MTIDNIQRQSMLYLPSGNLQQRVKLLEDKVESLDQKISILTNVVQIEINMIKGVLDSHNLMFQKMNQKFEVIMKSIAKIQKGFLRAERYIVRLQRQQNLQIVKKSIILRRRAQVQTRDAEQEKNILTDSFTKLDKLKYLLEETLLSQNKSEGMRILEKIDEMKRNDKKKFFRLKKMVMKYKNDRR